MRSNIDLPFSIGEKLYHVTFLNSSCGTDVAFISQYKSPVEGVQIDNTGEPKPVIDGQAMPFNTFQAVASKKDALAILAAQRPGTVYMDGKSRRRVFYANCGGSGLTGMLMTSAAIRQHIPGPIVADGPEDGTILIQPDARHRHSDDPVTGYRFSSDGRVTRVITGTFLCLKTAMRPDGLREVADFDDSSMPYVDPQSVPDGLKGTFSPEHWTRMHKMTVGEFADYLLQNFPADACVNIGKLPDIVLHFSPYEHAVILDSDLGQGLSEYQGHEPKHVNGGLCAEDVEYGSYDGLFDDD